MFRAGTVAPGTRFMRGGPIDDQSLHGTILKPKVEIFSENRVSWLHPVEGVEQAHQMGSFGKKEKDQEAKKTEDASKL